MQAKSSCIAAIVAFLLVSSVFGGDLTTSCADYIESVEGLDDTTTIGFSTIPTEISSASILSIPDCFSFSDVTPSPLRVWFPHNRSIKTMFETSGTAVLTWKSNDRTFGDAFWDTKWEGDIWDGPQTIVMTSAKSLVPATYTFPDGYLAQTHGNAVAIIFEGKPVAVEVIRRKKKTVVIVRGRR